MKIKTYLLIIFLCLLAIPVFAQTEIIISDPDTWTTTDLSPYVGQTVIFRTPLIVTNNYYYSSARLSVSPARIFSPTNQAIPLSNEYDYLRQHNNASEVTLSGVSGYHRMGEKIVNLTARVVSTTQLTAVGEPQFVGNTREDMESLPSIDSRGRHTLLICAMNLEYYLVSNLGTGYGPDDATESQRQHTKIMAALSKIKADIYGFLEIEQGQAALEKLAQSLTSSTGKQYSYINDHGSANGSYTKSGYVYCTETVTPQGDLRQNNSQVSNRKMMQAFKERSSDETFIFSINHFKAKSGTGTGLNADQGDGQGIFNNTRKLEAQSVLAQYSANASYYGDDDLLIMGDLNAYAKEDPIRILTDGGMTDLHRYFHKDSSYSYVFHNQAGYLDHALANATLLPQITGMAAWHINSDEHDRFTYDKSSDQTMFRSSDHDPILVGLRLGNPTETELEPHLNSFEVMMSGQNPLILNASEGYYRIYTINGLLIEEGKITNDAYTLSTQLHQGLYLLSIYAKGTYQCHKLIVKK